MTRELIWLDATDISLFQEELLRQHGGIVSAPRLGALQASLAHVRAIDSDKSGASVPALAAAYAWEFARNQVFADGNQRLALAVCAVFLTINGFALQADEVEAAYFVRAAGNGQVNQDSLTDWVAGNSTPITTAEHP
jgi:death-on-curing protein